jgi:hypothetical protein
MGDILKRINNTVCIVVTWIYAPFVTCMWVLCKLQKCKCQIELYVSITAFLGLQQGRDAPDY